MVTIVLRPLPEFAPASALGGAMSAAAVLVKVVAGVLMLRTRINPLWLMAAGGALGGIGLL